MGIDKSDLPLSSLFSDLTRDTIDLIRQEITLARTEMSVKISNAQVALTSVAIGAAILLAGLFIILQAVVNAVEMLLPPQVAPWLAPLIVGIAVAVVGYMMLKGGTSKLTANNLVPQKTIDSLKRDKTIVQEKI